MSSLSNRDILSVSDLTRSARMLLEGQFPSVFVEGEISNFSKPASGHWYFTLKDDKSQLRCAMFKGRNSRLRFVPRNGLQVIVRGKISLYEGRGDFQMIAEHMEEAGDGALRRAFEKLKASLEAEGLFAEETKRPLPSLPSHLAVITSRTGAAVRDVLHVFARRFPALNITILPVAVQGDDAGPQIVKAIKRANEYTTLPFDAILLTRGGGSLEDLWAFNTEPVARAIFESEIPIVSAVGHETDVTIADFVADLRAPTPSAAAELLSPDQASWIQQVNYLEQKLLRMVTNNQSTAANQLGHLRARLRHPGERLNQLHQRFDDLDIRLQRAVHRSLQQTDTSTLQQRLTQSAKQQLQDLEQRIFRLSTRLVDPRQHLQRQQSNVEKLESRLVNQIRQQQQAKRLAFEKVTTKLSALSPLKTLERGYSIVTKDNQVVTDSSDLTSGDTIEARLQSGRFTATVNETET